MKPTTMNETTSATTSENMRELAADDLTVMMGVFVRSAQRGHVSWFEGLGSASSS